ncbi:hypothetical protein HII31_05888 [Pseudocercospora fuligena]|uniref:Telomeric single stranded DNA binding POT1/Cdc13 domain-containing protein n=1 Tax=Pseudocercospora fuligena TaxID=685502 RepID=A0A8H6RJS7_9PEZI|nr:hypothetical protein HII31_05888 [Pseudocercospora fuligena]
MAESTIGIQALSPDAPPPASKSIRAKISLIWPYSSSTKQCALLLADPDFRLRNDRGQVRVRFTGASATAVAQGKVSIGDELLLELHGATWAAEASNVNTPGKSVEGELVYRGELGLQIVRKAGATEDIDQRIVVNDGSTPPPEEEEEQPRHETPARNARVTALGGFSLTPIYSSPAFVKRQRLSGGSLFFKQEQEVSDPVAEIEKELEEDERRPKKKQRISDVRDWRFTNRTPSPEKTLPGVEKEIGEPETRDDEDDLEKQVAAALADQPANIDNRPIYEETAWSQAARQTVQQQAANASLNTSRTEVSDAQSSAESRLFGFTSQDRSAAVMQPPPLPKLQMPEDPFLEPSRQVDGTKESGPSTPKLRPVPGYNLPLPSPFLTDAQQSPLGVARPAEPVPTEHEIRQRQQSIESSHEITSDESAVLEINPTIAALARQSQQLQSGQPVVTGDAIDVSQSTDSGGFPTALSQAPRARVQHSIDSETVATPDTEIRDDDEDEDRQSYHFRDTSGVFDQVQSQHPQYLSDTEEDEELEQLYTQAAQRKAEQRRLREGVKERDFARRPRAGCSADADGNPVPCGQALEQDVVHEDEAEEVIEDMGDEPQESSDDYDEADDADDESEPRAGRQSMSPNIEIENRAADSALEAMIDMGTRSMEAPIVIEESDESEVEENEPEVKTRSEDPAAQVAPAATKLPKTPAPPAPKNFGFGFGFDGTSSPPEIRSTPQSQKDRTMKKTYGSLFGFRVSPSPEKERQQQQQQQDLQSSDSPSRARKQPVIETPTPFGSIPRESFDNQITSPENTTRQSLAHSISSSTDQVHVEPPSNDNMQADYPASLQAQSPVRADALAEQARSPPRDDGDHTVHESQLDAALASSFGTGTNTTALHTKQAAEVEQEQRPSGERESEGKREEPQQFAEPALPESRSQAQSAPQSNQYEIEEEPKHQQKPFIDRPRQEGPPPSSAPVRALGSQKVTAPPSSTAPRPSQVEIIDLGSSSDAAAEDAGPAERLDPRHDPSVAYDDQHIGNKDSDAQSADEDTEVVPSPEATELPEPVMIPSETNVPSEDIAGLETLSPAAPFIPETLDNQAWPESDQGSFFAEQMQAGGLPSLESRTMGYSQQLATAASQASDNEVADWNSQVPLQPIPPNLTSFAGDLGQIDASLVSRSTGEASITGQTLVEPTATISEVKDTTEIIGIGSSSPAAAPEAQPEDVEMADAGDSVAEILVKESSERAFDEAKRTEEDVISRIVDSSKQVSFTNDASASGSQRLTRARAHKLTQQSSTSNSDHPQVQIAASSFVDETPQTKVDEHQETSRSELPITPDESQHRLESQPFQTQIEEPQSSQDLESQPFETQIPTTSFVPPTPEVTNEGLKVVEDAAEQEPTETKKATSKRPRRRAESGADNKTPVRRSTRKSQAASQSQEDAEGKVIQAVGEPRLSTPDAAVRQPSVTASAESDLLSPVRKTPVRRSPRKSAVESEVTEKSADLLTSFEASPPKKTTTRKSSRKSKAESQLEDEMKRANEESVDEISPRPKKASTAKKQVSREPAAAESEHSEAVEEQVKSTPAMTPARKSFTSRLGQVPEVISAWFSPRRPTRSQAEDKPAQIEASEVPDDKSGLLRRSSSNGLTTTKSYYYPLSNIEEKLNPSSQPGVDNTVDVIALVTDASSTPERAKSGPKDFFTIFKVTDQSLTSEDDADELGEVRVEVYRHWHATLPVASPGDVVLLRGFSVKSRKRRPYLLSGDASAWLVWRFSEVGSQERETRKRPGSSGGVREEVKGPSVEFAEGERKRARELRDWWVERQAESEK